MKLSDTACRNVKPNGKTQKLADGQGLYLEVTKAGNKLWRYKYRYNGSENRLALGAYPEVSLQEARDKHSDARKLLANGIDPSLARKKQRADSLESAGNTFKKIALEWCEHILEN